MSLSFLCSVVLVGGRAGGRGSLASNLLAAGVPPCLIAATPCRCGRASVFLDSIQMVTVLQWCIDWPGVVVSRSSRSTAIHHAAVHRSAPAARRSDDNTQRRRRVGGAAGGGSSRPDEAGRPGPLPGPGGAIPRQRETANPSAAASKPAGTLCRLG